MRFVQARPTRPMRVGSSPKEWRPQAGPRRRRPRSTSPAASLRTVSSSRPGSPRWRCFFAATTPATSRARRSRSTADGLPIPDVLPRRSTPEGVAYFDVDGYPLAYRELGNGPPLVLIHGSVNDYRAWNAQLPAFAREHRTIAVSLRHCYPEHWDGIGGGFTVSRHANDVAALIQGLRLGRADIVGHSRGGAVAIQLALGRPELVRKLVLADPGGLEALLPDSAEGRAMARESAQMFARLRQDLVSKDVEAAARAFVEALGGPGAWERRAPEQRQVLLDNIATGP